VRPDKIVVLGVTMNQRLEARLPEQAVETWSGVTSRNAA